MASNHRAVLNLLQETDGAVLAEEFLLAQWRANRSNPYAHTMVEEMAVNKTVQHTLNQMEGLTANQIRSRFFKNHPYGQPLADMLSKATSYEQRFEILMAGFGLSLPKASTLAPLTRARLDKLLQGMESKVMNLEAEAYAKNREWVTDLELMLDDTRPQTFDDLVVFQEKRLLMLHFRPYIFL